jgi:hypothetical protein
VDSFIPTDVTILFLFASRPKKLSGEDTLKARRGIRMDLQWAAATTLKIAANTQA